MIGKIIALTGLIAVLGFVPLEIQGENAFDKLHEDLQKLQNEVREQNCLVKTGNVTACEEEKHNYENSQFIDKLGDLYDENK
jgi:formylmethanofuran dehydrogenase subunit A